MPLAKPGPKEMSKAVAKRTATILKRMPPIAQVVVQIRGHFHDAMALQARSDKHRLQAGQKLLSLRQRIEAGEEGDIAWWDWFETQDLGRGRKDCERLMQVASSEWPEKAMADERERVRLAVAKHREKKKADVTVTSKRQSKAQRKAEAFWADQAKGWEELWQQEHPGRSLKEYRAGLDDSDGEVWEWRRAKGRASIKAEQAAWLADHPGNPLPEHMCSLSDEEYAGMRSGVPSGVPRPKARRRSR
jgi:hypothetical protein